MAGGLDMPQQVNRSLLGGMTNLTLNHMLLGATIHKMFNGDPRYSDIKFFPCICIVRKVVPAIPTFGIAGLHR